VIVTIELAANVSYAELETELRQRLKSNSFSVEHIAILDDQQNTSRNKSDST
jgi:DNA-dependent RNA polymerase auxiliary subunit epsilon